MTLVEFLKARLDEDEAVARGALCAGDLPARWETEHGGVRTAEAYERPGYSQDGEKIPIARVLGTVGEFRAEMRNAEHVARHDPARVLAEVDAKRRLVELHMADSIGHCLTCSAEDNGGFDRCSLGAPCPTLRLLALPYADHPDYDESWKP